MKRSWLWALGMVLVTSVAAAGDPAAEASEHFRRAVTLYDEADYRAALVEFKKAYQMLPNAAVLYNIGQASYQLRDYAAALSVFEQYIVDGGPTASHREEVLSALQVLRSRVGRIKIVSKTPGIEITVDDEPVATATSGPFPASIGRRKIVASHKGSAQIARTVEVSAGETTTVEIDFEESPKVPTVPVAVVPVHQSATEPSWTPSIVSYSIAGAFAVGATVTGIFALKAKKDLDAERDGSTATRQGLDDAESRRKTFSLTTDILAIGAVTAAAVGVYFTVSPPKSTTALRIRPSGSSVAGAIFLEGTFQ